MLEILLGFVRFSFACPVYGFSINPKYSTLLIKSMGIFGQDEKVLILAVHENHGNPVKPTICINKCRNGY
jgi:hypothetical protein